MSLENTEVTYKKLESTLEDMTKTYRILLEVVRKEKELLLQADRDGLDQNNASKEEILFRLRAIDSLRTRYAEELAVLVGADFENPRLLDLATRIQIPGASERLRTQHAALDTLIKRIVEINKDNEAHAASALKVLNGAMDEIKEAISGKPTYEKKGSYKSGPQVSGNFVSKEA